jgi:hypothetical protein
VGITAGGYQRCKPPSRTTSANSACKKRAATRPGRDNFGHHAIAVRDQDGFAAGSETDIFAQLIFENFEAD